MDLFKCLHLSNIITLMNMCIQTALDETLMILKGIVFSLYYYTIMFYNIFSPNNYTIFMFGLLLGIFYR